MKKYLFLLGLLPFLLPVGNALAIGQYLETCTATTSYGYITASPNDSPTIGASGSYQPCATIDNSGNAIREYSTHTPVTVTAIPNGLNTFSYWMGAGSECAQYNLSTTNPLNTFPDSPPYNVYCILRAVFDHSLVPQQTLTVINQYLHGYVDPNCGSGCQEDKDSIINLTAYPDGDQFFSHWTGTNNNAVNPTTVTMSSDRNVEAIYVPIVHLSSFVGGGGGGSVSGAGKYGQGDTAILTATPATNYSFSHWSGNASGSQNPLSVVMTGDKSITANFSYHTPFNTINTAISPINTGSIQFSVASTTEMTDGSTYDVFSDFVQATATPATGYHFVNWNMEELSESGLNKWLTTDIPLIDPGGCWNGSSIFPTTYNPLNKCGFYYSDPEIVEFYFGLEFWSAFTGFPATPITYTLTANFAVNKYKCSGAECVEDENGTFSTYDCDNTCSAGARYSCSKSSCVSDDQHGIYAVSNCNNQCSAPGPQQTLNYPSIFNSSEARKPTLASTSDMMASVGALVLGLWPLLAILLGLGIAFYILYEILDI